MDNKQILNHFLEAQTVLAQFIENPDNISKIEKVGDAMVKSIRAGGKIMSCGNGGSMSDAMHFAEEMTGRFRENRAPLPAIAISDVSHMSCVSNDYGFDFVFSRFVEALGKTEDVLLAISTSGNSKNIIEAVKSAKAKGIFIVALTGKDGGALAKMADIEIRTPMSQFADRVQEIHIKIIHALIHYIESKLTT